jgi:hypothetical protein
MCTASCVFPCLLRQPTAWPSPSVQLILYINFPPAKSSCGQQAARQNCSGHCASGSLRLETKKLPPCPQPLSPHCLLCAHSITPNLDLVLLSQPDLAHFGALPALLAHESGLSAPVYAAAPIVKLGQILFHDCFASQWVSVGKAERLVCCGEGGTWEGRGGVRGVWLRYCVLPGCLCLYLRVSYLVLLATHACLRNALLVPFGTA